MKSYFIGSVAGLAVLLSSCSGPCEDCATDGGPGDAGAPFSLEVGTGSSGFVALHDGDAIPIVPGPQGGFHLWTSVRAGKPVAPSSVSLRVWVWKEGSSQPLPSAFRIKLAANGEHFEYYGLTAFVSNPAEVRGHPTLLKVELTDAEGRTAVDQRRVVPQ